MKAYFLADSYPEVRCVIKKAKNAEYSNINQSKGIRVLLERNWIRLSTRIGMYKNEKTLPAFWKFKRDAVIHTFNSVILGKSDWCCNFETTLPRTNYTRTEFPDNVIEERNNIDKMTLYLIKQLTKENCLKCMALSKAAQEIQFHFLDSLSRYLKQEEIDTIKKKTIVVHPPQERLANREEIIDKFTKAENLHFVFVGYDFFRKGGKQIFDVLEKLYGKYQFHLTVVSNMSYGDKVNQSTKQDAENYKKKLQAAEWVTYYETLPNSEVLELCKKAHIGLLPTFAETYGYSVLEMQACGCLMVTTDIRALTEINNTECGFLCSLPQNQYRAALMGTAEEKEFLRNSVAEQLEHVFQDIFAMTRQELLEKALLSADRIEREHNPGKYSELLEEVYRQGSKN